MYNGSDFPPYFSRAEHVPCYRLTPRLLAYFCQCVRRMLELRVIADGCDPGLISTRIPTAEEAAATVARLDALRKRAPQVFSPEDITQVEALARGQEILSPLVPSWPYSNMRDRPWPPPVDYGAWTPPLAPIAAYDKLAPEPTPIRYYRDGTPIGFRPREAPRYISDFLSRGEPLPEWLLTWLPPTADPLENWTPNRHRQACTF